MTIDAEKRYPISEIFTSWQGEGAWSGTRMTFIRFAGCNVGKNVVGIEEIPNETKSTSMGILPIWQEECISWDGRKFLCDTDFRVKERLTAQEIIKHIPYGVEHIVFTGGEPLIHNLDDMVIRWAERTNYKDHRIHIETSGTKMLSAGMPWNHLIWVTVSPKINYLHQMIYRANELKLLVDKDFDEKKAEEIVDLNIDPSCIVWLSSINGVDSLDKANMDKCKEIAERHPTWRITQQAHKIWNVR